MSFIANASEDSTLSYSWSPPSALEDANAIAHGLQDQLDRMMLLYCSLPAGHQKQIEQHLKAARRYLVSKEFGASRYELRAALEKLNPKL